MTARRKFNPTSVRFDSRQIVRKQEAFNYGMVTDMAAVDIPYNATVLLRNARGHKNCVRGRTGSKLWSNLKLPLVNKYQLDVVTFNGNHVYTSIGGFTEDMVGCIMIAEANYRPTPEPLIIEEYINDGEMRARSLIGTDTFGPSYANVYANISAQFYDPADNCRYFLIGKKVYARIGREEEWKEYFILGGVPHPSSCKFYKIQDKIVLVNATGVFVLNTVYDGLYGWKANQSCSNNRLTDTSVAIKAATPSAYRYITTNTRMTGSFKGDRLNGENQIEDETPPVDISKRRTDKDYSQNFTTHPVSNSSIRRYYIDPDPFVVTGALSLTFTEASTWQRVLEENIKIEFTVEDGTIVNDVFPSFTEIETMADVASSIERALYDVDAGFRCRFVSYDSDSYFDIWNTDNTYDFDIVSSGSVVETIDLIGDGIWSQASIPNGIDSGMGVFVSQFSYPTNRTDISHYSLYRTKDIYPHTIDTPDLTDYRIQNSTETYGWVADIPCIDVTTASVVSVGPGAYLFECSEDVTRLKGSFLRREISGSVDILKIGNRYSSNQWKIEAWTEGTPRAITSSTWSAGTDTVLVASKTDYTITSTYKTFDLDMAGHVVFWADGSTDTIVSVTSATVAVVKDKSTKASQNLFTHPTVREYYDTVNDNVRDGYLAFWALMTRYFTPIENSFVSAYHNGVLMMSELDDNKVVYSDTETMRHIGYRSAEQYNDKVTSGVRCLFVVNDKIAVLTSSATYTINIRQSTIVKIGEVYTVVPDPYLVNNSIGAIGQFRTSPGERGDVMVFTSEPAIRFFNGSEYTANYADARIQETHLQLLGKDIITSYSSSGGIHIWGSRI